MRDTAKARAERVSGNLSAMASAVLKGNGKISGQSIAEKIAGMADLAVLPVRAPAHGAEWARAMLFFTEQLLGEDAAAKVIEGLDAAGVIWRQVDQVRAAGKQVGRLRSDTVAAGNQDIPIDTLVFASDASDFVGHTYVAVEGCKIPVRQSTGPTLKVKQGKANLDVPIAALRYIEAPMIRPR